MGCSQPLCERRFYAMGLCQFHYRRWHRGADLNGVHRRERVSVPCKVEGCDTTQTRRGHCARHYYKWMRAKKRAEAVPCCVFECEGFVTRKGMCDMHYVRQWKAAR